MEITGPGDEARWSALGRVAWVRSGPNSDGPVGMGVRFVDAEQAMLTRIAELVAARERTDPGTGGTKTPAREPTVLGVGAPQAAEAPAAPIIAVAPTARERTVLGVGAPEPAPQKPELPEDPPLLERSAPIDLVAARAKVEAEPSPSPRPRPRPSEAEPSEESLVPAGVPRGRGGVWLVVLLLLAGGGYAAYAQRARIPWLNGMIERGSAAVATPAPPTPSPASTPSVPASAIQPAIGSAASSTSPTPSAPAPSASTVPSSSASTAPAKKPPARPPAPRHGASDKGGTDNPY